MFMCPYTKVLRWVLNFFRVCLFGFCAFSFMCPLLFYITCQSLGSFVVTVPCDAVLKIYMQTLWISINGTLLPGKMTLSCSLDRVISVEHTGSFSVPRMF